jgi:hypothetical protein
MKENKEINRLIDLFISDCLLPSTNIKTRLRTAELFDIFDSYCEQIGVITPVSRVHLGRRLSKRFQRLSISGYNYFLCEYRPNLFEGVEK